MTGAKLFVFTLSAMIAGLAGALYVPQEPARSRLLDMLRTPHANSYTVEKAGKKLIHQAPFLRDGVFAGVVEIGIDLPDPLPHFVR